MNTEQFIVSAVPDPYSPGFSVQETSGLLLKKFMWRANTASQTQTYNEQIYTPTIYPSQVIGQAIPESPPTDFGDPLSDAEIISVFGITQADINSFITRQNGLRQFFIYRSTSYPYIYKVENCRLLPWMGNKDLTFSAISPTTGANLLEKTISFNLYNGTNWKGVFNRTTADGSISRNGYDPILATQLSFAFDYDSGIFTCYELEQKKYTPNPINHENPPAVSCYLYRGLFGNFTNNNQSGELWIETDNSIYYKAKPVLVGKLTVKNPTNNFEVAGTADIENIVTGSLETYSDRRLKENIVPLKPNYNLLELSACKYNYITKTGETEIGVIAQDVEEIVPEIVKERAGFKTVQYDRIGVLLLPIIKDLTEKINQLEEDNLNIKLSIKAIISSLAY